MPLAGWLVREARLLALLGLVCAAGLAAGAGWLSAGGDRMLREAARREAVHWADFLEDSLGDLDRILRTGRASPESAGILSRTIGSGGIFRYRFLDVSGRVVLASDRAAIGQRNDKPYFARVLAQGGTFVEIAHAADGENLPAIFGEAYVPIMDGEVFKGAVAVYVDMAAYAAGIQRTFTRLFWGLAALMALAALCAGSVILAGFRQRNRDLQELRAAQTRAADWEARLAEAIDAIPQGFAWFDADDRLTFCNAAFRKVLGIDSDIVAGRTRFEDLLRISMASNPASEPVVSRDDWLAQQVERHRNPTRPFEMRSGDGRHLLVSERKTRDGGVVGVWSDITDRKKQDEEIDRQTNILQAIFDNMEEGISVVDRNLDAIGYNRRFLELLDLPAGLFAGGVASFEKVIRFNAERGEYGDGDIESLVQERVSLAKRFEAHEIERTRPDGTVLEIRGNPMPGGGFVTTYTDVTRRKGIEEALRKITEGVSAATDAVFLQSLVKNLAEALGADHALLGEVTDETAARIDSVAVYSRGEIVPNFSYDLAGTPCETVVGRQLCCYPSAVQTLFPADDMLREMGAESYAGMPLFDAGGRPLGVLVVLDGAPITDHEMVESILSIFAARAAAELERSRAVAAVRESEQRFREFAESASDWFWETDADHRVRFISKRVTEVAGVAPEEFLGKRRTDFADLDYDPEAWEKHLEDLAAKRPFKHFLYRALLAGGGTRYFRVSGVPTTGEDGAFTGYRGTGSDVTAEIEAQARADTARALLVKAIEKSPTAIALYDADDRLVVYNDNYKNGILRGLGHLVKLGATFEELLRSVAASGRVVEALGREEDWIAERLSQHRSPEGPVDLHLAEGRWVQALEHEIEGGGRLCVYNDITETKKREDELLRARDVAELASRTKSEFLANMSHELRTPLNAIIGFSEVLTNQMFGPLGTERYVEYARDVRDSGRHLLQIINDILDVSKAEAGKLDLHEQPVDIADAIRASLRLVKERAQNQRLTLGATVADDLSRLLADERMIKQILLNLLSNAIKFTLEGGRVEVGAASTEDGGIELTIADTGIGIAEQDIGKVMEPFHQVDSSLTRSHEGTGLGLPLVKSLAALHGASLELESEVGVGTKATVRFGPERVLPH